ncbi:MAG: ABC transporter permease [Bacillota bacterium]|nr:ABC transporter permease [Bacillota bacterium]
MNNKKLMKARNRAARRNFFRVLFGRGLIAYISFAIVITFIVAALFCHVLIKYSPYEQDLFNTMAPCSAEHWLGTDNLGRDLLTRLMYGARISLSTGVLSSIWAMIVGSMLGLAAGYFGGWFGETVMRLVDAQLSIPGMVIMMCLAAIFGGSILSISLIIAFTQLPGYIRMLNGQVLSLKEQDFITATRLVGQSNFKILLFHLFPNTLPTIIISFTTGICNAIMAESGLAFLGIGISAPTPAWGTMVSEGYKYLKGCPRLALCPGIALMALVISLSIMGDGLRDALDPKLRGKL